MRFVGRPFDILDFLKLEFPNTVFPKTVQHAARLISNPGAAALVQQYCQKQTPPTLSLHAAKK